MAEGHPLVLDVSCVDADASELDEATRQLRCELESHTALAVSAPLAAVPIGAKSADPAIVGQLLLAAVGSGGLAVTLVSVFKDWLFRHRGFKLKLKRGDDEIEVSGLSPEEFEALLPKVRSWVPGASGTDRG